MRDASLKDDIRRVFREELAGEPFEEAIRSVVQEELAGETFREAVRGAVREEVAPVKEALLYLASHWAGTMPERESHVARAVEKILTA